MHIDVRTEIEAPTELVFDYLADLANNPQWQSGVAETSWKSPPPVAVGSTCEQRFDDGKVVGYRVLSIDPGKSMTIETLPGASVPATITRTVEKLGVSRSRVRMDLDGRVRGWRFVLTPLVKRLITRGIAADYRRLKKLLEPDDQPGD